MIRVCTQQEALEILQHPSVVKHLSIYPEGIKPNAKVYMVNEKCLLLIIPEGRTVETHISCKYRDRKGLRDSLEEIIRWLFKSGYDLIWTTAPKERKGLCNMLSKLGFENTGEHWRLIWV